MEFILNDEVGRKEMSAGQNCAYSWLHGTVESRTVISLHAAKEPGNLARPWHPGEFVYSRNQETWKPAIHRFIDRDNRKRSRSVEIAVAVDARNLQFIRVISIRTSIRRQAERFALELGPAPRTLLQRNWRRFAAVIPESN